LFAQISRCSLPFAWVNCNCGTDIENLSLERVSQLIKPVLKDPRYREKAQWVQAVIAQTRGLDVTVDLIEGALG